MMNAIVATRTVVHEDGRSSLSQIGNGKQGSAHGLLNWKEGTDTQIIGMADVASDNGPCGDTGDRDSIWVEVVLRGVLLEKTDCLGAMIHDLQVVLPYVNEKGIIDAREGNPLRMVFAQQRTAGKEGLVPELEPSPMEVDDQRGGLFAIDRPQVQHTTVVFLAIAQIPMGGL